MEQYLRDIGLLLEKFRFRVTWHRNGGITVRLPEKKNKKDKAAELRKSKTNI